MNYLFLLILIPILLPAFFALVWKHKITFSEFFLNVLVCCLITTGVYYGGVYHQVKDVQILNGEVTSKSKDRVSCSHSYSCNCRTVNKTTTCDTCYEHPYDFDWNVHSNVGTFSIDRIDRQGVKEPPRWTSVTIGEPVALEESYINYIKGSPSSIFNKQSMDFAKRYEVNIPQYPRVYDYHRANRVISVGVPIADINLWNDDLSIALKKLGPTKQSNVILIIAKDKSVEYAEAVNAKWLGGKKNDVLVILSVDSSNKISWVRVFGLTKTSAIKTYLRNDIQEIGELNRELIIQSISKNVMEHYDRKSMEDFKYLLSNIEISGFAFFIIFLLSVFSSAGISWIFAHHVDFSFRNIFAKNRRFGYRSTNRSRPWSMRSRFR